MSVKLTSWMIRFAVVLAAVAALAHRAFVNLPYAGVGVDDANIFFVYARNLAHGAGLVYNIGGERVEGFSSPLWVLISGFFYLLTAHPERILLGFNILVISLALTATTAHIDRSMRSGFGSNNPWPFSATSLLLMIWTLAVPGYICWTTVPLMETGLWSCLILLASMIVARAAQPGDEGRRSRIFAAAIIPLLLLARPEGMAWSLVVITLIGFITLVVSRSWMSAVRAAVMPAISFVATMAVLTIFRKMYFGYPLPNTYYAKVSPDRAYSLQAGWEYFNEFLGSNQLLLPLIATAALCALILPIRTIVKWRNPPTMFQVSAFTTSVFVLVGLLIPILVGGDHFRMFRFYQPIWPLIVLPVCYLLANPIRKVKAPDMLRRASWLRYAVVIPALVCIPRFDAATWKNLATTRLSQEYELAQIGRDSGTFLNELFAGNLPSVGAVAVGGIKYTYDGFLNDLMGLNNVEMAHFPGDRRGIKNHAAFSKDVFYRQAPDVMFLFLMPATPVDEVNVGHRMIRDALTNRWVNEPVKGLYHDAAFREKYQLAAVRRAGAIDGWRLIAFFRKDFLAGLQQGPFEVIVL